MSLVKHIEQIKTFIMQNIYFFMQLFLLAATFITWKLVEAIFSFHTTNQTTDDKDTTVNEEDSGHNENTSLSSVNEDEAELNKNESNEAVFVNNKEKTSPLVTEKYDKSLSKQDVEKTVNLQKTSRIQLEGEKENDNKRLVDKKGE